ncbi:hypothetical protein M153_78610001089, partial [Pseudoloma neurophilia]
SNRNNYNHNNQMKRNLIQRNLYLRQELGLSINPTEYVSLSSNDRKDKIEAEIDNLVCPISSTSKDLEEATVVVLL